MAEGIGRRDAGGFFASARQVAAAERRELLAGLAELDDRLATAGMASLLGWQARAAALVEPTAGLDRPVGRGHWLDLLADLAEASAGVAGRGLVLEALAMEGAAARLLGALLDGDRDPGGGGWSARRPPTAGLPASLGGADRGGAMDGGEPTTTWELDDAEWRRRLTPEQFRVLRQQDTDPPFRGRYVHPGPDGIYRCAGCGAQLFEAGTQFDSGSGWPSFTSPIASEAVELRDDASHGMHRVEVVCRRCGGHLGHVFPDGPGPTGERWCINSTSLELEPPAGS